MADDAALWGQDIALAFTSSELGQVLVSASGELVLTQGVQTGVQDIVYRVFSRLGTLFYDIDHGTLVYDWILEENTAENRSGLETELVVRVELDPRVVLGSVRARVLVWDEKSLSVELVWEFIGEDHAFNLVLSVDKNTMELVVSGNAPRADALTACFLS